MKNSFLKTAGKSSSIIFAVLILSLTACSKNEPEPKPEGVFVVTTSGTISHETFNAGQSATVSFSRFPASVNEFRAAQQQIGGEPQGAVALQLMAAEMYRRNANRGTQCIELCNVKSNIELQMSRWRQLFDLKDETQYARPYQIAAFLRGATPDNDYTPNEPYTVEVRVSNSHPYTQETMLYNATVITLEVLTKGKDSGAERVEVIKPGKCNDFPNGSAYFLIHNCPGLYSQVRQIYYPNWNKLK